MSNNGRNSDLVHKLGIVALAAYAWQLHGWLPSVAVLILLPITIIGANIAIMAVASEKNMMGALRFSRWGLLIAAGTILAISGASINEINP